MQNVSLVYDHHKMHYLATIGNLHVKAIPSFNLDLFSVCVCIGFEHPKLEKKKQNI